MTAASNPPRRNRWRGCKWADVQSINSHRLRNILQPLLPGVLEGGVDPPLCVFLNASRNADAAGLGYAFQTNCDVHSIAENVTLIDDDVAYIDADTEVNSPVPRYPDVALGHAALDIEGATHGIHGAPKFDESTIPRALHNPAIVDRDDGVD